MNTETKRQVHTILAWSIPVLSGMALVIAGMAFGIAAAKC